ncbi:MAG: hypothetical protein AAB250_15165 [Bdellovibrionota bacterium]
MKERVQLFANVVLFLMATLLLGTFQTSLWFQVVGYFPGPALWVTCLIYVSLFRSTLETVIFAYMTAFVLATMTAMPEGLLMVTCLALALSAQVFKQRIFWPGASYSMLICGLGALFFHLFYWTASFVIGDLPVSKPQIIDWLIEALLTPLAAPILFPVYHWIDKMTNREQAADASARVT